METIESYIVSPKVIGTITQPTIEVQVPTYGGYHGALSGRDYADQHPLDAIEGLETQLNNKMNIDQIIDGGTF